ncbi:MAG: hypothetical protein ACRD1B_06015 [Thermoanaerobaculia bacterium]
MAVALLVTTVLALAGFLLVSVQGFAVASGLFAGSAAAKALVSRHVGFAIPTVLLSLFSQSMVIFYFIGTGKLVKDETTRLPESLRKIILEALRRFKRQTSPPATFALASAIAVFVLGGAVHTRALPAWVHLASSVLAVALHVWALFAESRAFADNHRLMADPNAYARKRAGR